jgi:hypothetical protein
MVHYRRFGRVYLKVHGKKEALMVTKGNNELFVELHSRVAFNSAAPETGLKTGNVISNWPPLPRENTKIRRRTGSALI